jgi:hypothetical protein
VTDESVVLISCAECAGRFHQYRILAYSPVAVDPIGPHRGLYAARLAEVAGEAVDLALQMDAWLVADRIIDRALATFDPKGEENL